MSLELDVRMAASDVLGFDADMLEAFRQETELLSGWQLWMVSNGCYPSQEVFVATRDGAAIVPRFEEGFGPLADIAPMNVPDVDTAIEYVELFVGSTRPDLTRIFGLDDIAGLDRDVAAELAVDVIPPRARKSDGGWEVEMFLLGDGALIQGRFQIAIDGRIESTLQNIASGISIFGGSG